MSDGQNNKKYVILPGPLKTACSFCRTKTTDELKLGQVYSCNGLVVHYFCLLTASSLPQNGEDEEGILGFYLTDIRNEIKVSATRTCAYCKKKGASVSCCTRKCKRWFHLPCGRKNASLHQFFGRFKSFCSAHRPLQKGDKSRHGPAQSSRDIECPICYEGVVVETFDTLWAPCCKKNAWFHRDCVQKLALSAGYFFKCPLCNNGPVFKEAMEKLGIYIPQRDALWEQVPNAYQELLYQYRRCDAEVCKCPGGRSHNGQSNWELVRCKTCGSQGIHISCGRLKFSDPEWICRICKDVLKSESLKRGAPTRSRSASSTRSLSRSSDSSRSTPAEPSPVPQLTDADSQLSSNSGSNDESSQDQLKRNNERSRRLSTSNPSSPPSNVFSTHPKPDIVPNPAVTSSPIKRYKPCPKRFKKDYVDDETEEKSVKNDETKTEMPQVPIPIRNTSISLFEEYPIEKTSANNVMVIESDSDEEIEVLEVHRVLERKSLTTGDGTTLEVHPVSEKKKVLYEIRDVEASSSSASAATEVLKSPMQAVQAAADVSASSTPTNTPPWRAIDPQIFYKATTPSTSSTEKCDRLTEDTSGSRPSVITENFEARMKSSGCQINPVRSQPKTSSAAAEGKKSLAKPSVTVFSLTSSPSSNPDRSPVKKIVEPVPQSARPVLLSSGVTNSIAQPSHVEKPTLPARGHVMAQPSHVEKPTLPARGHVMAQPSHVEKPTLPSRGHVMAQPSHVEKPTLPARGHVMAQPSHVEKPPLPARGYVMAQPSHVGKPTLPTRENVMTQPSHVEKFIPPASGNVIEEITILDDPPQTAPITNSSNPPIFQPQIVNVRSCGNVPTPNNGPALIGPMVPIVQQTGSALNTNKYILCTTGLWIPTSDSGYMAAPIMNPEPCASMSQPPPQPTMSFDSMETNLNIKISDVRHSNEFFNCPSNSRVNFQMGGEMAGWTALSPPQPMNGIPPRQGLPNRVNLLGPPRLPNVADMNRGVYLPHQRPGHLTPQTRLGNRVLALAPDSLTSSASLLANRLTQSYGPRPTLERNSAPDVIVLE